MWYHAIRSLFLAKETPNGAALPSSEQRSGLDGYPVGDGWRGWGDFGSVSTSGMVVSRETALSVPAIWCAVDTISKTLASLPFGLFTQTDEGSSPAKSHPVYGVIKEPTSFHTSYTFRYGLFLQTCFGDAFAIIHRNGIGRPTELELLDAQNVSTFQRDNGDYFYIVRRQVGNRYEELAVSYENMLHVKGLTIDGICGQDITEIHKDTIGTSLAAEQFGGKYFANGAHAGGFIYYPHELKADQREIARKKFGTKYGGLDNVGKWIFLDGGMKAEKVGVNPQEAAMNETRNFQVNQVSRIFGVPVPLLAQMDKATLNNMETMGIQFVTLCLRPYAVQVEQEFARKLLTKSERISETYYFRFNFSGLLRGDTQARAAYYKQALGGVSTGIGWMSVNEVRELENLDRVDDGDEVFTAEKMQAAQGQNNEQEMEKPQTNEQETETNDEENGTPQASR